MDHRFKLQIEPQAYRGILTTDVFYSGKKEVAENMTALRK
jgi:hypothetical protein